MASDMINGLKGWILDLESVTETPHRFGGTEFRLHNAEFMHTHGPRHFDIRLSNEDQARMLKDSKAEPHLYAPQAGWVTFRIRSEEDIETAKESILLAYNNAKRQVELHAARVATPTSPREQRVDS